MLLSPVSSAEKEYIVAGCNDLVRADGRGTDDFRPISIENHIFPHVSGSSRVRVSDSVDILCSVKLEAAEPADHIPNEGLLAISVDISPSCQLLMDDRQLQAYEAQIAEKLQSVLGISSAIDLCNLCIIPGKFCWSVQIDLVILQMDGDPLETCSIASFLALSCAKVPLVETSIGESGLMEDFEVLGDLSEGTILPSAGIPIFITVVKVGSVLMIDTSGREQACASCAVSIAVDQTGKCCGVTYLKSGVLTSEELLRCIDKAGLAAVVIFQQLLAFDKRSAALVTENEGLALSDQHPDIPPKRKGLLL